MSDLYARLKAISKAPPKSKQIAEERPCAVNQRIFALEKPFVFSSDLLEQLCRIEQIDCPEKESLLFLDTETTGLGGGAGTIAFLVGVGWLEGDYFICRQYWIRNYDEEADLISRLEKHFESHPMLVTFNGKTFDIPLLRSRFIMQQKRMKELDHLDLLSYARKIFKLRLSRVNLTALETALLGQTRQDDLPGSEAPQRFFDYLKTGNESLLKPVFEHNAQDVYSLSKLLKLIAAAYQSPESLHYAQDLYSIGKTYEKSGNAGQAERCYVLAAKDCSQASVALGRIYKRSNRYQDAVERYCRACSTSVEANVELAKLYEHRLNDPSKALSYTDQAIIMEQNAARLVELFHRRARLIGKIQKGEK